MTTIVPSTLKEAKDHYRVNTTQVLSDWAATALRNGTWGTEPSGFVHLYGDGVALRFEKVKERGHIYAVVIQGRNKGAFGGRA
jgi:hypothetical protein